MEINKQLFEDILLGKLKGTFVLRENNRKVNSGELKRNNFYYSHTHPYKLLNATYNPNGKTSLYDSEMPNDIIDFIPETDMKEKELKIEIPEGYEIDKERSTFEKIVFKKKDTKPRTWAEYCDLQKVNHQKGYYINDVNSNINRADWNACEKPSNWKNVLSSEELADAFLAMMQLISLRQSWIDNCQPDWNGKTIYYCIVRYNNGYTINECAQCCHALSFPTEEMAFDFMNCFKDLLEVAKSLI